MADNGKTKKPGLLDWNPPKRDEPAVELYRKHRPRLWKHVVGQDDAVETLQGFLEGGRMPQAVALIGPSGCGKTTLANICASKMKCFGTDLQEINAAESRGIDTIREINQQAGLAPMASKCRVWILDEVHKLSGDAASALLVILENPPRKSYFFLCTTNPEKLPKTLLSRCTKVKLNALQGSEQKSSLERVLEAEGKKVSGAVLDKIVEVSDGNGREAMVLLHQVLGFPSEKEQLENILPAEMDRQSIELCRLLMNEKSNWKQVAAVVQGMGEQAESVRMRVLHYATATLLKSGNSRAARVIQCFRDNYYDSGRAGLVLSCFDFFNTK
jgi:DNA polymerase-3 subunit gamma/tau